MGIIVYNGKSSDEYSILVEHPPGYEYPEKDLEITHVPGRNGDVVFDLGSYKNVDRTYEIAAPSVSERYEVVANRVSEWLHSATSYARLEDTYEPEYFRMALYKESNILECLMRGASRAKIKFNCKPQRFLKSGEIPILFSNNTDELKTFKLINPTGFASKPIIKIKPSRRTTFMIFVGDTTIRIESSYSEMYRNDIIIDCDMENCYFDNTFENANSYVELTEFPKLKSGLNDFSIGHIGVGEVHVEIIPRWWTL